MDIKQLIFKLTRKQLDELEKLSSAMGNVSKSNLIRIAITEYLMIYGLIKLIILMLLEVHI